ncbi:hypothetical protein PF005_g10556 [Phytophthora fragariae]|uniref:RxLR effector protein n=2 Tax=Phytophthora TaxID=4783 RepID=A0A6A3ZB16_9STRA|nr:hypothetical protein PF003_g38381 [Phytophthora fragariae]KAE9008984.1 hypothetical protein PR001_g16560 [Phytophthora rubi]KAE8938190.1 hypothetical protein PF009_g11917 [Phytophthora fragariae]KAE9008583.1 hypothetical protein PF011_g10653 [Phytophthora fragariae]KAE9034003.1 hypothetical protein PR002_g8375 [Phytophthora rubi]
MKKKLPLSPLLLTLLSLQLQFGIIHSPPQKLGLLVTFRASPAASPIPRLNGDRQRPLRPGLES